MPCLPDLSAKLPLPGQLPAGESPDCVKQYRAGGLLVRKVRWGLSWRGRLLVLGFVLLAGGGLFFGSYPFLAVTEREETDFLVVEGWVHQYGARGAAAEFIRGHYRQVFTTGGPVMGSGPYSNDANTGAWVGAEVVKRAGIPEAVVQMVPSRVQGRDRTYNSALALRRWLREHQIKPRSLNVLTEDAHARRTRFLFQMAFGDELKIGIISVPSPDYEPRRWWSCSEGVREVIGESIAYGYARFFFHPEGRGEAEP